MKNGLCANELIKALCDAFGPSGCEGEVAALICSQIDGLCDSYEVDRLGNIVARMHTGTGEARAKLMLCAHMDEVGFMVTGISADGYLRFANLGGISPPVLCGSRVSEPEYFEAYTWIDESGVEHDEPREKNPNYPTGLKRKYYEFMYDALPGCQTYHLSNMATRASDPENKDKIKDEALLKFACCSLIIIAATSAAGLTVFKYKNLR